MRKPGSRFKPALSFACLCVWQIRCLGAAVMDLWPACLILLVVNPGTGYLVGGIPVVVFLLQGLLLLSAGVSMSLACITLQSLLVFRFSWFWSGRTVSAERGCGAEDLSS